MENEEEGKISLAIFKNIFKNSFRILQIIWREHKKAIISLLLVFVLGSTIPFLRSGAGALLINQLVKIVGGNPVSSFFVLTLVALILMTVLPPFLFILQNYILRLFWFFLGEKFELLLMKKKGQIDIAVHENPKYNDLFNKVNENGIWRIQNFTERQFFLFQNVIEVVIATVILIAANWWLFILLVLGSVPELIVEVKYGREVWGIHSGKAEIKRRFWNLQNHFTDLPKIVELKLFQNTGHFFKLAKDLFQTFRKEELKTEKKKVFFQLSALFCSQIVVIIAIVLFVFEVVHGKLQIGTLTFILASMGELRQSLSSFFGNLGRQYQDNLFVNDLFNIIDIEPEISKALKPIVLAKNKTPEIVFENVSFKYQNTSQLALKNFSLTIKPGEKIALVGINGAGKTTFVKLLCRFYDPTTGRILIDGHDLKEIDLESLYHHLGVLFQEYAHYNFLAKESIAVGNTQKPISIEDVKKAAKDSESNLFIEAWDNQYDQMIGKQFTGGVEPSVGQWQKLALARTFYRDPQVMILDEPTASIDAEAEAKIFERMEMLSNDKTVILISHRFSTVRQANKIAVIKDGGVKELGTHEELLKLNGIYSRLFKLQAKGYK